MTTRYEEIAGFRAVLTRVAIGGDAIALWQVADLERHVDRAALLAGDDPAEPPYWAHLWSGARVLASLLPPSAGRVLDLGCGLGLAGLVAARRGARVVFVDREARALAFVRASAATNALEPIGTVAADFVALPLGARFDVVLAAEVLYDRGAFAPLAATIARHLAPGGSALIADAQRIDTRAFYDEASAAGLGARITEHRVREEGFPLTVRIVEMRAT